MISVLSRPADQIGISDIQELIDSEVPEGDQIEFKEALSTRDRSPDRWVTGADKIGDRARNEILEEAVAFANAYAGILALGIAESRTRPRVAARVCPIPRCVDLAERLKQVFGHCVEPQIPSLEIFAVPTSGDSGVVIIRVGQSRMAPHRVRPTRECTIRRADRCEKMTMREIQDLTLNLARGLERLERRLALRSERFVEEFKCLETPEKSFGIRATAAPVGEQFQFERVYDEDTLYEPWNSVSVFVDGREYELEFPWLRSPWRPMLRAARCEYSGQPSGKEFEMYREIHFDGIVEIGLMTCRDYGSGGQCELRLYPSWIITMFSNLVVWADRVRSAASAPAAEYAVDVEVYVQSGSLSVAGYGQDPFFKRYLTADPGPDSIRFPGELLSGPRYSLGEQSEITELIAQFERDFWNSAGEDVGKESRRFVI